MSTSAQGPQCFGKVFVMRKLLISLLLASAAASPALAGPRDWSDRQQSSDNQQPTRQERQQAREQARADRSAERPSFTAPARMQPQQYVQRQQFNGGERFQQQQVDVNALRAQRDARVQQMQQQRAQRMEQVQQRQQDIRDARDLRQSTRPVPNVMRDRHPLVVSDTPRFGTQPPLRAESHVHWNTNWRNDGRHDWRRFRDHHRSRFHLGFFIDPFGWGYQPFDIGYRLWPAYYGNQYWLDAGYYGLPYPPPGAIWVRYFNDALLVDTYSGTVIDVIPGFFW